MSRVPWAPKGLLQTTPTFLPLYWQFWDLLPHPALCAFQTHLCLCYFSHKHTVVIKPRKCSKKHLCWHPALCFTSAGYSISNTPFIVWTKITLSNGCGLYSRQQCLFPYLSIWAHTFFKKESKPHAACFAPSVCSDISILGHLCHVSISSAEPWVGLLAWTTGAEYPVSTLDILMPLLHIRQGPVVLDSGNASCCLLPSERGLMCPETSLQRKPKNRQ